MRRFFILAVLTFNALVLNVFVVHSSAAAEGDDIHFHAPVVEPVRGNVSTEDQKADRAAKLKAKMKAIEEHRFYPKKKAAPVPEYRKTARGTEQIKAKEELSKDAGKRGTAKLKSYMHAIFGGFESPAMAKYIAKHGRPGGNPDSLKGMSFQERLKLELEKKRKRNEARKRAIAEHYEERYKNMQ